MRQPKIGDIVKVHHKKFKEDQFGFISFIGPELEGALIQIDLFNHPTPLLFGIEERNLFWAIME